MISTVRDADSTRMFPRMIPVLLEIILHSGEPLFHKDTLEYQFQCVLLEVLHCVPYNDVIRPQALSLLSGMLHILRHDNEENGVTSCKIIINLLRSFGPLTKKLVSKFMTIFSRISKSSLRRCCPKIPCACYKCHHAKHSQPASLFPFPFEVYYCMDEMEFTDRLKLNQQGLTQV